MKAKYFRWPFIAVLAALLAIMLSLDVPTTIGLSGESSEDGYRISGGTAPWALAFSVLIIALYLLLMYSQPAKHGTPFLGWWRRMSAFWLDFFLAIMTVSPIVGILPTLTEWRRTGVFAWNFERTTAAPGDGFLFLALFATATPAIVFYYVWPLMRRKPSPGACIMGYQIVTNDSVAFTWRVALKRVLWCVTFLGDRRRKTFRIDESSGTHAVRLD